MNAPVLTVRTRLFYARRELAEMMHEEPTLAQLATELGGRERSSESTALAGAPRTSGEAETEAR